METLSIQTLPDGRVALIANGERGEVVGVRGTDFDRVALAGTAPVTPVSQQVRDHLFRTSLKKGA